MKSKEFIRLIIAIVIASIIIGLLQSNDPAFY